MVLQQRNGVRSAANAIPEDAILDTARELVLAIGVRKLSMADLSRRAGVSRTTLYRRWSSSTEVLASLFTRELGHLAGDLSTTVESREQLVDSIVAFVRACRVHPLVRKVVEVDPEFLVPYTFERPGTSTTLLTLTLEQTLRRGMSAGWVRDGSPRNLARAITLTCWSFVLTAPALVSPRQYAALDRELGTMIGRYLA